MGILDDIIGNQDAAAYLRARGLLGRGGQAWAPPQEIAGKVAAQAAPRSYGVPGRQQAGWMPPQEIQVNAPAPSMLNPDMQFAPSTMDFSDSRMAQPQQAPQPSQSMPSLVGTPFPQQQPDEGPQVDLSTVKPEQRQMEATTAGTPQDVKPQGGFLEGLSGGLDRMTSDPLFNLGIGILSNPRNIGQGLATGLQSARAAKESENRQKLAERAANRKNIHWFMQPDGTLAGVDTENPNQLISPPGQTPRAPRGIIPAGEQGVPQGYFGVSDGTGGVASIHPIAQTPEQKLQTKAEEAKIEAGAKQEAQTAAAAAKDELKQKADRQKAQQQAADIAPVYERALDAYERALKLGAIGPWAASGFMRAGGSLAGTPAESARRDYEKAIAELKLRKGQEFMKGQGAVSDRERAMLAEMFPDINASNPESQINILRNWREIAKRRAAGDWSPLPEAQPQASGSVQTAPGKTQNVRKRFNPATGMIE